MEKPRILIIDDDPNIRRTLSDILKVKGYESSSVGTGVEGLDLMKQFSPNLAVIDLSLPDMSGLEVLNSIKTDNPSTEAIILTGNASLNSAMEAMNRGAFSYLTKPYDMDQLMLHIKLALEKHKNLETIIGRSKELERVNNRLSAINMELTHEIAERKRTEEEKEKLIHELKDALSKIKILSGLLPICANCKKIRNDEGYWQQIEIYIKDHSEADFTHGICPECAKKLYPELYKKAPEGS